MMTTATRNAHYTAKESVLFLAFELSEKSWKLGFTIGHGQKPRERTMAARDPKRLLEEVGHAKARFGLPETTPVVSCYEAGLEGFWLHRFLQAQGITNHVVDSSSIEVNRRKRRAKTDALDVRKLLTTLMLCTGGITGVACGQCALRGSRGSAPSAPRPGNLESGSARAPRTASKAC
jgi:transposase